MGGTTGNANVDPEGGVFAVVLSKYRSGVHHLFGINHALKSQNVWNELFNDSKLLHLG
jgi:hypothetical protein